MTQPQKFHIDDIYQCLHNNSGSHGVPNANLFNFMFLPVVRFHLCSLLSVNSKTMAKTMQLLHHPISAYDWIPDRFYVISVKLFSVRESQTFLLAKHL